MELILVMAAVAFVLKTRNNCRYQLKLYRREREGIKGGD